jgi:hypothetical protein
MVENWIDTLTKVWEISDGSENGRVKSFRIYERAEFPETLNLDVPTALTFVDGIDADYSVGGPGIIMWHGSTSFHVTPDLDRSRLPDVILYFGRILAAAAANMKLSGKVDYFSLEGSSSISLAAMQYGNEARHLGLEVKWMVKEEVVLAVGDPSL